MVAFDKHNKLIFNEVFDIRLDFGTILV